MVLVSCFPAHGPLTPTAGIGARRTQAASNGGNTFSPTPNSLCSPAWMAAPSWKRFEHSGDSFGGRGTAGAAAAAAGMAAGSIAAALEAAAPNVSKFHRQTSARRITLPNFRKRSTMTTLAKADGRDETAEDVPTKSSDKPPVIIFAAVFLHLLGFTMSGPILPALRAHFQIAAGQTGLITSAFPLGAFVAVLVFPALSDLIGRKPLLVFSYLGVGLGFIAQSWAVFAGAPFKTFLALRTLSGCFAGASVVVKAFIVDISSADNLPQYMAWRESAATLSFIIGPTLGGLVLACSSLPFVIFVEGCTSLLAGLLVAFVLTPRRKKLASSAGAPLQRKPRPGEEDGCPVVWGAPWVPIFTTMLIGCAYNFGQSFFDGFFAVMCAERFGLPAPLIGSVQTCMALIVLTGTTCLYGPAVRKFGLVETAVLGLFLVACGLFFLGIPRNFVGVLLAVFVYATGIPFFSPSLPTLLSRCAPQERRGLVLGVDSAVNSLGRIFAPALMGFIYEAMPPRRQIWPKTNLRLASCSFARVIDRRVRAHGPKASRSCLKMSPSFAFGLVGTVVGVGAGVMMFQRTAIQFLRGRSAGAAT